jgi:predicted nuclease of predicted toxin-antitoxin system
LGIGEIVRKALAFAAANLDDHAEKATPPDRRSHAAGLRGHGYDCLPAGEVGMSKATDEEILVFSLEKRAVAVTLDADFHTIFAVARASAPPVIRLRSQGLGAPQVVELVPRVATGFEADLKSGSVVTVKARKTTCHRLPIGGSA